MVVEGVNVLSSFIPSVCHIEVCFCHRITWLDGGNNSIADEERNLVHKLLGSLNKVVVFRISSTYVEYWSTYHCTVVLYNTIIPPLSQLFQLNKSMFDTMTY